MSDQLPSRAARPSRRALPVLALTAAAVVALAGCGQKPEIDHEVSAKLIQPVARVELRVEQEAPGNRTGEQVYKAVCTTCHAAGVLGAPATGDEAQWAPRMGKGFDALMASVINGLGAMPARGGGADLLDVEVQRATAYLLNTVGGGYTEAPVE